MVGLHYADVARVPVHRSVGAGDVEVRIGHPELLDHFFCSLHAREPRVTANHALERSGLKICFSEHARLVHRSSTWVDALGQLPVSLCTFTDLQSKHQLGVVVKQTLEHRPEGLRLAQLALDVWQVCGLVARDERVHEVVSEKVVADDRDLATALVEHFDCSSSTIPFIVGGVGCAAGHHQGDDPLDLCEATLRHVLLEVRMFERRKTLAVAPCQ